MSQPPRFGPNPGPLFKKKKPPEALPLLYTYEDIREHFNAWARARGYTCRLRDGGPCKPIQYYDCETGEAIDN